MTNRIIIIIIFIVISLVLIMTLILPKYRELNVLRVEVDQREAELQRTKDYFTDLYNMSEELKEYQESLSKIDSALPSELSFPSLLDYLEKISAENDLILASIGEVTTYALDQRPNIQEHRLGFSLAGSYSSFKEWLHTLEKSSRLIEVTSIDFSTSQLGQDYFIFALGIKFYSY
ncbi:hypothetical protein AMJ48_00155 [Parcubacteria bacterium DG_74_1]|nr:MAG: hypothetical protein AMJ48_00155 [Parcubacteria bacterium DG_74_1]